MLLTVRMLWSRTFRVPPTDESCSQVTVREALEFIHASVALAEVTEDARKELAKKRVRSKLGDTEVEVRTDEEARKLADTPLLTGNPEWDAIELAATDPSRPPIEQVMRRRR
jgi:hypothetical protein